MKTYIGIIVDEHSHPVVRVVEDDDAFPEPDDEDWIVVELAENISLSGKASDVQRLADEIQMKVRTV